jgi:hypothetical protein
VRQLDDSAQSPSDMYAIALFVCALLFFHTSEVAIVAWLNYDELSWSSCVPCQPPPLQ